MVNNPGSVVSSIQVNVALTSPSILDPLFSVLDTYIWNFRSRSMVIPKSFAVVGSTVYCVSKCWGGRRQVFSVIYTIGSLLHFLRSGCNWCACVCACVLVEHGIIVLFIQWPSFKLSKDESSETCHISVVCLFIY